MKKTFSLCMAAALCVALTLSAGTANATLQARSQQLDAAGLPFWYQDITGAAAQPCVGVFCGLVVPNGTFNGTFPVSFPGNYPEEFFYWSAQSAFFPVGTFTADVLMALEIVFVDGNGNLVGPTAPGAKPSPFQRLNITVAPPQGGQLPATGTLTAVGPWGTSTFDIAAECGAPQNNKKCQIKRDLPTGAIPPINFDIPLGAGGFTVPNESITTFLKQTVPPPPAGFFGDGAAIGATSPPATVTISGTLGSGSISLWTITGQTTGLDIAPAGAQDFGVWKVGATSTPVKTFTITNLTGSVTAVPVITPPPGYTLSANTCTAGLNAVAPGNTCTFDVAFAPLANAVASGNITILATPAPTATIPVTGTGDSLAPVLTLDPVVPVTKLTTQTISGSVSDNVSVASVQVSVNGVSQGTATITPGNPASTWTKSITLPNTNAGNSISVTATDTAQPGGNVSGAQTATITNDTINPVVSVSVPVNGSLINNKTPALNFNVNDANLAFTTVSVDNAVVTPAPATLGPLADGLHTVKVDAGDAAGNAGTASTSFTVDATGPVFNVTSPAAGKIGSASPLFTFTVTEPHPATPNPMVVKVDGAVVAKVSGDTLGPFAPGAHTLQIDSADTLGNTATKVVNFTVVLADGSMTSLGALPASISDALLALRVAVGLDTTITPGSDAFMHGDVAPLVNGVPNPDGKIDISDALTILRKVVGIITF